jgi:hypothetical protein
LLWIVLFSVSGSAGAVLMIGGRPITAEQPFVGPGGIAGGAAIAVHFGAGVPASDCDVILMSVVAVTEVTEAGLTIGPLFAGFDSMKAGSFSVETPLTVKLWFDASVQVTVHENGTAMAAETARGAVTVAGLGLPVEQSAGMPSVATVSVITGPVGPLLWVVTVPLTINPTPAATLIGDEAEAAVVLMSARAGQAVSRASVASPVASGE